MAGEEKRGKENYKKGRAGETKAVRYLKKQGMTILARNFRALRGEIDVVAKDGETVVFAEVKTRFSSEFGEPSEAVDFFKQRKYALAAEEFLEKSGMEDAECRFDVVEVKKDGINHIKAAFIT